MRGDADRIIVINGPFAATGSFVFGQDPRMKVQNAMGRSLKQRGTDDPWRAGVHQQLQAFGPNNVKALGTVVMGNRMPSQTVEIRPERFARKRPDRPVF